MTFQVHQGSTLIVQATPSYRTGSTLTVQATPTDRKESTLTVHLAINTTETKRNYTWQAKMRQTKI